MNRKMKKTKLQATLIFSAILISSCRLLQPQLSKSESDLALQWQQDIDAIIKLHDPLHIPQYLLEKDSVLHGDEFDVMSVFSVLDHLKMSDGYRLAYYYHYDDMGAYPVLYALPEDSPPFTTEQAYQNARPECFSEESDGEGCYYLDYVETDGSEMGYLQLLQLSIMGGQFYLNWHANYNDCTPIATKDELDKLIDKLTTTDFGLPLSKKQARQSLALDPMPVVEIKDDTASVRVFWFSKWNGFSETWYKVETTMPHTIFDENTTLLLEYDCGIRF